LLHYHLSYTTIGTALIAAFVRYYLLV